MSNVLPSREPDLPESPSTKMLRPPMPPVLLVRTAPSTARLRAAPAASTGGMIERHLNVQRGEMGVVLLSITANGPPYIHRRRSAILSTTASMTPTPTAQSQCTRRPRSGLSTALREVTKTTRTTASDTELSQERELGLTRKALLPSCRPLPLAAVLLRGVLQPTSTFQKLPAAPSVSSSSLLLLSKPVHFLKTLP